MRLARLGFSGGCVHGQGSLHTGLVVAALLPAVSVGATDLVSVPAVSLAEDVAGVRRASTRRGENAEGLGG